MSTIRRISLRLAQITNATLQKILTRFGVWSKGSILVRVRGPTVTARMPLRIRRFRIDLNAFRQVIILRIEKLFNSFSVKILKLQIARSLAKQRSVPFRAFTVGAWERAGALRNHQAHLHFIPKQRPQRSLIHLTLQKCGHNDVLQAVKV